MSDDEGSGLLNRLKVFIQDEPRRIGSFILIFGLLIYEIATPNRQYVSWQSVALIGFLLILVFLDDIDTLDVPGLGRVDLQKEQRTIATAQWLTNIIRESSTTTTEEDEIEENEIETPQGGISEEYDLEGVPVDFDKRSVSRGRAHFYTGASVDEISDDIYSMAQENPRIALVKLRSEIEGTARELAEKRGTGPIISNKNLLDVIRDNNLLRSEIVDTYSEVQEVYTKTIEQNEVNFGDVLDAIDVGLDLLKYLKSVGYDDKLLSRKTYWTGLDLLISFEPARTGSILNLRTANDEIGALIKEFRVDENGEYVLQSDKIGPGRYVICQGTDPIVLQKDGEAHIEGEIDEAAFEFVDQILDVEFKRGVVVDAGQQSNTRLLVNSNRGSYVIWIGCDALGTQELESIFVENSNFIGAFDNVGSNYVAFRCRGDQELFADFTGIEPGDYSFSLIVPDTHVRDIAEITVKMANQSEQ